MQFSICNRPASPLPAPSPLRARRGLSLIEVLASIGVLTIGLLSLAALLPVGQVTIFESVKADRSGTCGRAAMRDVVVRRMLDYHYWCDTKGNLATWANFLQGTSTPGPWFDASSGSLKCYANGTTYMPASFIIDPLGATAPSPGMNGTLGNTVPRISLATFVNAVGQPVSYNNPAAQVLQYSSGTASAVFRAADDLVAPLPEKMKPALPVGRPLPQWDTSVSPNALQSQGDYTWFLSVSPEGAPNPNNPSQFIVSNPTRFTVSVVVCYRRVLSAVGEQAVPVKNFWDGQQVINSVPTANGVPVVAAGGGSVQLQTPIGGANNINVRENDWVALCNNAGMCRWYRVVAIGDDTSQLTLSGPDWPYLAAGTGTAISQPNTSTSNDTLIALGTDVVGVYTTTVDLDTDATWKN